MSSFIVGLSFDLWITEDNEDYLLYNFINYILTNEKDILEKK